MFQNFPKHDKHHRSRRNNMVKRPMSKALTNQQPLLSSVDNKMSVGGGHLVNMT